MGVLEILPDAEQFTAILAGVIGSEEENTGLGGVFKLLQEAKPSSMAPSLVSELDGIVSSATSIDTSTLTEGIQDAFNNVEGVLPTNPIELVAPLLDVFGNVKNLSSIELADRLLATANGFQNIQSLIPADTLTLLSGAADGISQLKDQFISGSWGEIRQWSETVQVLYEEIEPLFTEGPGTVEDRLIAFLADKISDLVQIIFPQQQGLADIISSQLDQAISTSRIETFHTIKTGLINQINQVQAEFEEGNFSNIAALAAAEASFQQLTDEFADILEKLSTSLDGEIATAEGMVSALQKQFDDFETVEIVDLGNIKDKFLEALNSVEDILKEIKLEVVTETIEEVFDQINGVVDQFNIKEFTSKLAELQQEILTLMDGLDALLFEVIASIRNTFTQLREALRSVASTVGNYDEEGNFHFSIEQEIINFLSGLQTTLLDTVQPKLEEFKAVVDQTMQQVHEILTPVKSEVEAVKNDLLSTLNDVNEQLKELDVAKKLKGIRNKLDSMLEELASIEFDPVVDPVIDQIEVMRDELREIDLSSVNEAFIALLKLAVEVIKQINFPEQITQVLLNEIDKILEIPKGGLKEIEGKVEQALEEFSKLEPDVFLQPIGDVFNPVTELLDALQLERLLEPLDDWHARVQKELDNVSPEALLQPVIDVHDHLKSSFASISPEALVQPLQVAINSFKSDLQRMDVTSIADELGDAIDSVKNQMDEISPDKLFAPLVNAFDKILAALDRFNPGDLLEPFANIFNRLTSPLDNLTEEHVRLIGEAFADLKASSTAFDPQHNFQMVIQKYNEVQNLLQQINVGQIISDLKAPYDSMKAAFEAGGSPDSDIANRIEALNPLRNENIAKAAAGFQQFQTQLQNAYPQATPASELLNRYEEMKPKLESLIPAWIKDDMTSASIKVAFHHANPLNIVEEVNHLYQVFKDQLQNFNPRILQENVKETYEHLKETFSALDPQIIVSGIQNVLDNLIQKLDAIDLQIIVEELQAVVDEVETIIKGMDPRPIIQQLEDLNDSVKDLVEQLKPSVILSELQVPFQTTKDVVEAFNPSLFKDPLIGVFTEIQDIIAQIDIGIILQPLGERLDDLRDELEKGLKRTETAFGGMIGAIPV